MLARVWQLSIAAPAGPTSFSLCRSGALVLTVISPAKSLDFDAPPITRKRTMPAFLDDAQTLIERMRGFDPGAVSDLMHISTKLGELNADRYASWSQDPKGAKQAALAFAGDVYMGLRAWEFSERDLTSAQRRLRILSGLYGLLRPLDLIHPYRLEMGTSLSTERGKDLYQFWGSKLADSINAELAGHRSKVLVNLASNEYFRAVDTTRIDGRIITPTFKELRDGQYKFLSFVGKRARGTMAAYIIRNKVETIKGLKAFADDGYYFSASDSTDDAFVFLRDKPYTPAG